MPTVIEKAKEYFGCDNLEGVELENYGKSSWDYPSSHWDSRMVLYDFMTSYIPLAATYSPMTLAVLADSGWYEINWEYAQISTYGRNKGCGWINKKCIVGGVAQFDEFCDLLSPTTESSLCGTAQIGKTSCEIKTWSSNFSSEEQYFSDPFEGGVVAYPDYCPTSKQYSNGDCRLWSDNNIGASYTNITYNLGGLISGNSKCLKVSRGITYDALCAPTECFKNSTGSYVGTRSFMYSDFNRSGFNVMTCWKDESGYTKNFDYQYAPNNSYGFDTISCPDIDNLCYDENPWYDTVSPCFDLT